MLAGVRLELDWDPPPQHRRGAATRLDGIDVFHDFDWLDWFPDQRTQFINGQCLAKRVRDDCPEGKTPGLLLTIRDDVEEGALDAGPFYLVVVHLPRYLENAAADAAVSYLASRLGPGITRAVRFPELAHIGSDELDELLNVRLDAQTLARWAAHDEGRLQLLRSVAAGRSGEAYPEARSEAAIAALEALDDLDPALAGAIADLVTPEMDEEARLELLLALTSDPQGRHATVEALSHRTRDRLMDARSAIEEFERLIEDPDADETDLQQFLEGNPWLLGLDYAEIRPRHPIIRGTVDFILQRFDGFHDLLELKGPQDNILEVPTGRRGARGSASGYRLSRPLAQALAQVHVYRDALRHEDVAEQDFGLPHSRDPKLIIIIGSAAALSDDGRRILRELNRSLHRVEVVPYDVLGERASATLDNVERYLTTAEDQTTPAG